MTTTSGGKLATERIPELDGLRGLAIGSVLFFHYFGMTSQARPGSALAYFFVPFRLSWSGVDLFFVLSGFLIGGILLDARTAQNYFKVFYKRRFFRIVPAYVASLGVTVLLGAIAAASLSSRFAFMSEWMVSRQTWIPHLLFIQNFWMAASNSLRALDLTWSLAVEEQFYLTLPLLVWLLPPRKLARWVVAIICLAPVIRFALLLGWPEKLLSRFVLMPCRADALMLGVLGAILTRDTLWRERITSNRTAMRILLAFLAVGFVVLTLRSPSNLDRGMQMVGYTWLACFYLCILLYGLTNKSGWLSQFFRARWLGWLGGMAYGVYLFHVIVLQLTFGFFRNHEPRIGSISDAFLAVLALALTLVFCRISWIYFEKPLVKLGHREDYEFAKPGQQGAELLEPASGGNA